MLIQTKILTHIDKTLAQLQRYKHQRNYVTRAKGNTDCPLCRVPARGSFVIQAACIRRK